jgi:hypothetical protein
MSDHSATMSKLGPMHTRTSIDTRSNTINPDIMSSCFLEKILHYTDDIDVRSWLSVNKQFNEIAAPRFYASAFKRIDIVDITSTKVQTLLNTLTRSLTNQEYHSGLAIALRDKKTAFTFYTSNAYYSTHEMPLQQLMAFLRLIADITRTKWETVEDIIQSIFETSWLEGFIFKNGSIQSIFVKHLGRDSEHKASNIATIKDMLEKLPSLDILVKTDDNDAEIYLEELYEFCEVESIVAALLPIDQMVLLTYNWLSAHSRVLHALDARKMPLLCLNFNRVWDSYLGEAYNLERNLTGRNVIIDPAYNMDYEVIFDLISIFLDRMIGSQSEPLSMKVISTVYEVNDFAEIVSSKLEHLLCKPTICVPCGEDGPSVTMSKVRNHLANYAGEYELETMHVYKWDQCIQISL